MYLIWSIDYFENLARCYGLAEEIFHASFSFVTKNENRIAPVLGSIPSGLFIITIRKGEEKGAFLASWIQQASFHPPMVTIAMANDRPIGSWFQTAQIFGIHILGDHHKKLLKHFANPPEDPTKIFDGLHTHMSSLGIPVLTESASLLECSVMKTVVSGDHTLVVGEVMDAREFQHTKPKIHVRKTGFQY